MLFNKIFLILMTLQYKCKDIPEFKPCNVGKITNNFIIKSFEYKSYPELYYKGILLSPLFTFDEKCYMECLYVKTRKILNSLNLFYRKYKLNKCIKYNNENDLYLNPLKKFKNKHKITLCENNTLYTFRLCNLVNYWVECLYNSEGLFPAPINLRNPYTNIDFFEHNLYNIYFKLLETNFTIPTSIIDFFICNMNKDKFLELHYTKCQEKTIHNFIKFASIEEKFEQILNMLHEYRKDIDYITFPHINSVSNEKKATIVFNDVLLNYLTYKFSCNPLIKKKSKINTRKMLIELVNENIYFGFEFNSDVIRYIPRGERRRIMPPPPPPESIRNSIRRRRNIIASLSLPPPPPPPVILTSTSFDLDSDEEEIQIFPQPNETTQTTETETTMPPVLPAPLILPPIQNTQNSTDTINPINAINPINSIRSSLSFNTNTTSPFMPSSEIPRSPVGTNRRTNRFNTVRHRCRC